MKIIKLYIEYISTKLNYEGNMTSLLTLMWCVMVFKPNPKPFTFMMKCI